MPNPSPYGSWKSPITSDMIVSGAIGLGQVILDGDDIYWVESRPAEGGRNVLVRHGSGGEISDVTPQPFNVRTRVHEYGGGAVTVADGVAYFCNFVDQRVYRLQSGRAPEPITPAGGMRYADLCVDRGRGRLLCVLEDHSDPDREAANSLVSLDLVGMAEPITLFSGSDFCSSPCLSPDGSVLAWLSWDHPNMPWDGSRLWSARFRQDGSLETPSLVAGGDRESIFQPHWSPDGVLYFVSDRTNWWNLYAHRNGNIEPVAPMAAEFARPQWMFGTATYGLQSDRRIICSYTQGGVWRQAVIDLDSKNVEPWPAHYTEMYRGDLAVDSTQAVMVAGSPSEPYSIVRVDLDSGATSVLRRATSTAVDPAYLSTPEPIEFSTENGATAHALYYPPKNGDFTPMPGELPPLLVKSHGGPAGAAGASLDLVIQYWTSRGFAVVDVNYGGSTGYGREYRERLRGRWGIVDVEDCVNAAQFLVATGRADGDRLVIDGGSAGGFTTLAALTFRDVFRAGASSYGVSDLETLAKHTHKFESRYLDSLIGPYPQEQELYRERSPINHVDRMSCPLILFQGLEDEIVPPEQAEVMYQAVKVKGIPTAYLPFEGEQHGFRQAANVKRVLDAEFYFYSRVFRFSPADDLAPVDIDNL